ncbi:MAG: DUF4012 domain-containing protein [bacterium]|nr:DUF4012 domain-containing protein [bacterium]
MSNVHKHRDDGVVFGKPIAIELLLMIFFLLRRIIALLLLPFLLLSRFTLFTVTKLADALTYTFLAPIKIVEETLFFIGRFCAHKQKTSVERVVSHALPQSAGHSREHVTLFLPPKNWHRSLGAFAFVSLLFLLPFGAIHGLGQLRGVYQNVVRSASNGMTSLTAWKNDVQKNDLSRAQADIEQAIQQLNDAHQEVNSIHSGLISLAHALPGKGKAITDGESLLKAASLAAMLGSEFTQVISLVAPNGVFSKDVAIASIPQIDKHILKAIPIADEVIALIQSVDESNVPAAQREQFVALRPSISEVRDTLHASQDAVALLSYGLGYEAKRRYLAVFQNNTELRPTGGFIGSFALVDVDRGAITKIEFPGGGSYDLQGGLAARLAAPLPLRAINPRWEFQDANWFTDFPMSAQKLAWFFEKSGGSSVDGVIAINASFFEKLLDVIGSVSMPRYGVTVTSKNFINETTKQVELKYDKTENKPKKFLADLLPIIMDRLAKLTDEQSVVLAHALSTAALSRDVQVYFSDKMQEDRVKTLGVAGDIRSTQGDFLSIVDTNIGGNKSDQVMSVSVSQTVSFAGSGKGEVLVHIERKHAGVAGDLFTGSRNRVYTRLFVPVGSELISTTGFAPLTELYSREILPGLRTDPELSKSDGSLLPIDDFHRMITGNESGKTTFGGIIDTNPGFTSAVDIRYRLPFSARDIAAKGYTLIAQRASGSRISDYALRIVPPGGVSPRWVYPNEMHQTGAALEWRSQQFLLDHVFGVAF